MSEWNDEATIRGTVIAVVQDTTGIKNTGQVFGWLRIAKTYSEYLEIFKAPASAAINGWCVTMPPKNPITSRNAVFDEDQQLMTQITTFRYEVHGFMRHDDKTNTEAAVLLIAQDLQRRLDYNTTIHFGLQPGWGESSQLDTFELLDWGGVLVHHPVITLAITCQTQAKYTAPTP